MNDTLSMVAFPLLNESKSQLERMFSKLLNVEITFEIYLHMCTNKKSFIRIKSNDLGSNKMYSFIFDKIWIECCITPDFIKDKYAFMMFEFRYNHPNAGSNGVELAQVDFDFMTKNFTLLKSSKDYDFRHYRDNDGLLCINTEFIDVEKVSFKDFFQKLYDNDESCKYALHLLNKKKFLDDKGWKIVYNANIATFAFAEPLFYKLVAVVDTTDEDGFKYSSKRNKHGVKFYKYDAECWTENKNKSKGIQPVEV